MIPWQLFWWILLSGVLGAALVQVAIETCRWWRWRHWLDKVARPEKAFAEHKRREQVDRDLKHYWEDLKHYWDQQKANQKAPSPEWEKAIDDYCSRDIAEAGSLHSVPTIGTVSELKGKEKASVEAAVQAAIRNAIPTIGTAEKVPCKTCGGRMVFGDLSFCPDCTKHIRPLPFTLDLQGKALTKADIVDFARIVGWHRIACWTSHRDALLGISDVESNWAKPEEASAWLRDQQLRKRGNTHVLFGRPIRTADYAPTDRLLSYDLAGDWTGQIINIGKTSMGEPNNETPPPTA